MPRISPDDFEEQKSLEEQKSVVTARLLLLALQEGSRLAREENERLGLVPVGEAPAQQHDFREKLAATLEEAKRLGVTLWAPRQSD